MNGIMNMHGKEENSNLSIYHERMKKYRYTLEKIKNMEFLIKIQTQKVSQNSLKKHFQKSKASNGKLQLNLNFLE